VLVFKLDLWYSSLLVVQISWAYVSFTCTVNQERRRVLFHYVHLQLSIGLPICLGGLVVSVLATGPKVAGSIPAEVDGFFRVIKICSTTSFRGEVKPSVPCRRFKARKRTLRA
jgi:hypothetical protein